ncbi:thioredoxin-like domain-containing protein [Gimesia panareensis]|uniref:Thiol-disulfide oxidoreductase YkuV n=1 Tax=Gimesia panareensis TaxID=2527978 RepID=A0A518ACP2_9PLAN|nr:thioredoxin-like domain-containing protein [Gimesia panareensis]QDT29462.1 Thiol-disulfide oxidoreductase YkuV [Gimesia panareensis]QDU52509.1 Thiol-disulfide oxidoreductase YkuV [Gimesia panareensis]
MPGKHAFLKQFYLLTAMLVGLITVSGPGLTAALADEKSPAPAEKKTEETPEPEDDPASKNPFPNRPQAPSLDGGTEWLNTSGEITLKDLRGKVVLIDFWTYCCINCMHVLPDLAYLEKKYPNELVVIGCHSAKFDNEKETDNIRRAIQRYEIKHPVINDSNMTVWRKYGVRAWPSMVLIDPEGKYCGHLSGEGNRELLDKVLERVIAYHRAKGTLDETPVHFDLESAKLKPTPLKFPGKLLADAPQNRLFISDSNHNRIVIASLDGKLIDVIGSGQIGNKDGDYKTAAFDHPQGMALVGNTLYVADTENHLIRKIDLDQKQVSTLAGTGEQARYRSAGGKLRESALNSPWALAEIDGVLYICMAGPHQIWSHKLGSDEIGVYAGSGREDIVNGPLDTSAFAQTSDITVDGDVFYVVDSEGSAVRKVDTKKKTVSTIAGTSDLERGRSLFEFGDKDGVGMHARLQHPLGVLYDNGRLFIADTYNHKLKTEDLKTFEVKTFLGTGKDGNSLNPVEFSEPSGLAKVGNRLFVADTNNHRICVVNLDNDQVSEFKVQGLTPPELPKTSDDSFTAASADALTASAQKVAAGVPLAVTVTPKLSSGYKLSPLAPVKFSFKSADDPEKTIARGKGTVKGNQVLLALPALKVPDGNYLLNLRFGYCRDGVGGLCKQHSAQWKVPVQTVAGEKNSDITLSLDLSQD